MKKKKIQIPKDVLEFSRLHDFPPVKDADDVRCIERLAEYRIFLLKKAGRRLKKAVKTAIKETIERYIDYIFGFTIGLFGVIIAMYILRHFIF